MQESLRNRLTYGPIMLAALGGMLYVDFAAERWTEPWMKSNADFFGFQDGVNMPVWLQSHGIEGIGLLVLMVFILPFATVELARLFTAEKVRPYRLISGAGSASLAFHAFLTQFPRFQPIAATTLAFIIVGVMLLAALRRASHRQSQEAITHMAGTVLATLYLGGLSWFLLALRVKRSEHFNGSTISVLMILLVVKFTDIGAFAGGKMIGRHKLIPWLSPGKTWEGLFCGMATAALVGCACAPLINWPEYHLEWGKGLVFGAVIGAIGQAGDLLESLMKRDADVKDSGKLVPGFGGVLDVIDSPLLAAPFAYVMFSLM